MAEHNLDALILQIAQGSREALRELYEAVYAPVYPFALSMTKEPYAAIDVDGNPVQKEYRSLLVEEHSYYRTKNLPQTINCLVFQLSCNVFMFIMA